jgi:hypothetical protein
VTKHLGPLIADAGDPAAVTRFWEAALGEPECHRHLIVCPERQAKVVKNRVHLDVYVRDIAPLLALGAVVLAEYLPERLTLADVDGNEFCAFIDPHAHPVSDPPARVFAVCTDSDRPEELARWWAPLVGVEIGPGSDGTKRWLYGSAGWPQLVWKFIRVSDERSREETTSSDERVVPNRWQWSVTGTSAATSGEDRFVDPQGNEFSVMRSVRRPD